MTASALASQVQETIDFVKGNPAAAIATYRARVELEEGTRCSAFVRKFPAITVDEPASLGGEDAGPNPVEYLLVSLGACQEIVYSIYASMMEIELESVSVKVKGKLDVRGFMGDPDTDAGYQSISYETRIVSPADPEEIAKLVGIVEARCPTLDTLQRPIAVEGKALHNGTVVPAV